MEKFAKVFSLRKKEYFFKTLYRKKSGFFLKSKFVMMFLLNDLSFYENYSFKIWKRLCISNVLEMSMYKQPLRKYNIYLPLFSKRLVGLCKYNNSSQRWCLKSTYSAS